MKTCRDFYGEELKIGDAVIPMCSEAAYLGIQGIITDMYDSPKYNTSFITISDSSGQVLLENVNAKYYSTNERYQERHTDFVYSLDFMDKDLNSLTWIPLTKKTNLNYQIPKETARMTLKIQYSETKKGVNHLKFFTMDFLLKDVFSVEKIDGMNYLIGIPYGMISNEYRRIKDFEGMQKLASGLIEFIKNADENVLHADSFNDDAQLFKIELILRLKTNLKKL